MVYSLWRFETFPHLQSHIVLPLHTTQLHTHPHCPDCLRSHMTASQLSCDLGQREGKVLVCMHILPLVDGQPPQVSLIFELEYEDIAF